MNEKNLTSSIDANLNSISTLIPYNSNVVQRELLLKEDFRCVLLYINGLVNKDYLDNNVLYPLLFKIDCNLNEKENPIDYISKRFISASNIITSRDLQEISRSLKLGDSIILLEGSDQAIICKTAHGSFRAVEKPDIEKSVRGSKESFVENIETNIAIIQKNLKNKDLKIQNYIFGDGNQVSVVLLYIEGLIDSNILENIKNRLEKIQAPEILGTGYIEQLTDNYMLCPFPLAKNTERPMKVVSDLLQGKAAIVLENTPFVLILPVVFTDFFQGVEDYLQNIYVANFSRLLRIFSTFLVLTLSPIYLVVLAYNSELLPLKLITTIINSRTGIPLPPFLEILAMELTIELLREGGLRLPSPLGQTLSIVGGIVIGEASIRSGIVSPPTLIVVSFTAISTFLIPNYDMALSIRILRLGLLAMAQLFSFLGILIGLAFILVVLIKLESYGVPYFSPLAPLRHQGLKDTIIRSPLGFLDRFPVTFRLRKNRGNNNEKEN